ncbi:unnamed protein product [Somion occarium]|uniref:F-box domain-containing protein n=1 Tax=Somion occarium TaxID=3059160 RepID=A0ABP1E9K6_9APHY
MNESCLSSSRGENVHHTLVDLNSSGGSIASLPPELWVEIFLYCVDHSPRWRLPISSLGPSAYTWTRLCHVCRQWRAILLSTPILWNRIVFTHHTDAVSYAVERSKAVPIHLYYAFRRPSRAVDTLRATLVTQAHRIQTIDFRANNREWLRIAGAVDPSPSPPALQSIQMSYSSFLEYGGHIDVLADVFLRRPASHLEYMCLSQFPCTMMQGASYSRLRHLKLQDTPDFVDMSELLDILASMPYLFSLDLDQILINFGNVPSRTVTLLHLQTLRLATYSWECTALLNSLAFPPSAYLKLRILKNWDESQDDSSLSHITSRTLTAWAETKPALSCTSMRISHGRRGARCQIWTNDLGDSIYDTSAQTQLDIRFNSDSMRAFNAMLTVASAFATDTLRSVHIDGVSAVEIDLDQARLMSWAAFEKASQM